MNSIIEAQLTLVEEMEKEIDRCTDPYYLFQNYWQIKGFNVRGVFIEKRDVDRETFERFKEQEQETRHSPYIPFKSLKTRIAQFPLTPKECFNTLNQ